MNSAATRRVAFVLLLLVPAAGVLTACGPGRPGAAATLKGGSITIDQLQQATSNYVELVPGTDEGDAQEQILNRMIASRVIEAAAAAQEVSVREGEVAAERDRILQQVGGRAKLISALAQNQEVLAPGYIDRWARDRVLVNKLVEKVAGGRDPNSPQVGQQVTEAFVSAAKSLNIKVNPRYGSWNADQLSLEANVGGGLSKTLAERTKTAPGS